MLTIIQNRNELIHIHLCVGRNHSTKDGEQTKGQSKISTSQFDLKVQARSTFQI